MVTFQYTLVSAGYYFALDKAKMNRRIAKGFNPKRKPIAFRHYTKQAIDWIRRARNAKKLVENESNLRPH